MPTPPSPGPPRARPTAAPLAALLLSAACGTNTLSESWQLDRLRLLAVRGEPAEPRPGDLVRFDSLTYLPPGEQLDMTAWFACLPDAASEFGCELDTSAFDSLVGTDIDGLTAEQQAKLLQQLVDAGLIGVEPWFPPSWTAPLDALDELDEADRLEGVSAVINLTAVPAGAEDEGDTEIAYKRLPISEALTPNHNPDIVAFRVNGRLFAPGGTVGVDAAVPLEIEPVLAADAIETYLYRTSSGVDEERTEEPYVTWYTEAGRFDQPFSLYPELGVTWTAPGSDAEVYATAGTEETAAWRLIAVVRDRRGGMAWASLQLDEGGTDLPGFGAL